MPQLMPLDLLRLVALDNEDLAVVSAHLQDSVVRIDDLAYFPRERRFAVCARRFDWEGQPDEPPRRRLTALHFERVLACRTRGIDRKRRGAALNLLAVTFAETDAPSGTITLLFSEGAIQLDVECVEAQMKDMGPVWEAEGRPRHPELERT